MFYIVHWTIELCVLGFFDLLGISAYAKNHANVETVDEG